MLFTMMIFKGPACTKALLEIIPISDCSSTRYQIHGQTSYTIDVMISIDGQTPSLLDESKQDN